MNFREWLYDSSLNEVTQVGYQDIRDRKLYGPVYHGTTEDNYSKIIQQGFRVSISMPRSGDSRNGYELQGYGLGDIPPPVHHLGYGIYFTEVKNIAKNFNVGMSKNIGPYYLDIPRMTSINFGSSNTMMKWWRQNGYDMESIQSLKQQGLHEGEIQQRWIQSTVNLTNKLKSQYDAVLFKGKGLTRLLDGNQICVYDPSRIYLFNAQLNADDQFLVSDRAKIKGVNVVIQIEGSREKTPQMKCAWDHVVGPSNHYLHVKIKPQDIPAIKEFYAQKIYDVIFTHPDWQELHGMRMQSGGISKEESASKYVDYLTDRSSLQSNFPEALLEKKVKKGERLR